MFTMSITSTTSSKAGFSARIGPFSPQPPFGPARRRHVNDSNRQCWHVVYTDGGLRSWRRSHKGDLVGKTRDQIRALHFRRDRDWLQS